MVVLWPIEGTCFLLSINLVLPTSTCTCTSGVLFVQYKPLGSYSVSGKDTVVCVLSAPLPEMYLLSVFLYPYDVMGGKSAGSTQNYKETSMFMHANYMKTCFLPFTAPNGCLLSVCFGTMHTPRTLYS